mgnify:CR=1 FL=1
MIDIYFTIVLTACLFTERRSSSSPASSTTSRTRARATTNRRIEPAKLPCPSVSLTCRGQTSRIHRQLEGDHQRHLRSRPCGERLSFKFHTSSPCLSKSDSFSSSNGSYQKESLIRHSRLSFDQKCSRNSTKSPISGLLQQFLHCPQEGHKQVESNIGPLSTEPLPSQRVFQNGDCRKCKKCPSDKRVGMQHRLDGCLLSCVNCSLVQKVSSIRNQWSSPAISRSPHGSIPFRQNLQSHSKGDKGIRPKTGHKLSSIPRRLANKSPQQSTSSTSHSNSSEISTGPGLPGKHFKIRTHTQTGNSFSGIQHSFQVGDNLSHGREMETDLPQSSTNHCTQVHHGQTVPTSHWDPGLHGKNHTERYDTLASNSTTLIEELVPSTQSPFSPDTNSDTCKTSCTVVARGATHLQGGPVPARTTPDPGSYRRLAPGLGRGCRNQTDQGDLVSVREVVTYKCLGSPGNIQDSLLLPQKSAGQVDSNFFRQCNNSSLPEEGRGDPFLLDDGHHLQNLQSCRVLEHRIQDQTCTRSIEPPSGHPQSSKSNHCNRVDNSASSLTFSLAAHSTTPDRPVCYKSKLPAAIVRVPSPRPEGSGCGRTVNLMARYLRF